MRRSEKLKRNSAALRIRLRSIVNFGARDDAKGRVAASGQITCHPDIRSRFDKRAIRTEVGYDITFEVYDAKGRLLASNRVQELKMYGPTFSSAYRSARKKLPATIRNALAEGVSPLMKHL